MTSSPLTVTVSYDGQVCVLAAIGDLDLTTAARFARCASRVVDDQPDRLVFDLARLDFLDCVGARALAETAQSVPVGCPVIVRAVSPPAARLLGLLALDLEHAPATTAPIRQPMPAQTLSGSQTRVVRLDEAKNWARCIRAAQQMAATEDQVAATFARLAARRPHRADQLTAVSQSARINATRARQWADDHQALAGPVPRPPVGGRRLVCCP